MTPRSRRVVFGIVAALWCAPTASPQPPAFRSSARLVVVHVTVANARGEPIAGLGQNAFMVYENGRPQRIALFRADDVPVSIGLVIDNSGSMRTRRQHLEAAALSFLRASNPDDEAFVLNFADAPRIDVAMTTDLKGLETRIRRVDSIGGTALRDALDAATAYLTANAKWDRRVLLVISDGDDNASTVARSDMRQRLEKSGIAVYAIALLDPAEGARAVRAHRELDQLTIRTGGTAAYPPTSDAIGAAAAEFARQIRAQYTIGYAPVNAALDGTYRAIRVRTAGVARAMVRARPGYWASPLNPAGQ